MGPKRVRAWLVLAAGIAVALSGCGAGPDRSAVLGEAAESTIVPAYVAFAADAETLAEQAKTFCTGESTAADFAADIEAAHRSWAGTEAMWIGPVMERRSWAVIDWPIAPDEIDELLADSSIVLDEERIATRIGADQRGLGALEHLIAGAPAELDDRRCEYLTRVASLIATEANLLVDDWTVDFEDGGPWSTAISAEPNDSVDALVNDSIFMLEAMADGELGSAIGEMERDADPDALAEGPFGFGVADLRGRLEGLRALLVGSPEAPGLSELLGEDLVERLDQQIAEAESAVMAIDGSLARAVVDDAAAVSEARAAIKAVQVTVSTEVVSQLGVTIGFSDADGDTGG